MSLRLFWEGGWQSECEEHPLGEWQSAQEKEGTIGKKQWMRIQDR